MYINNNLSLDKLDKSALIARVIIFVIFILLFFAFWNIQILKHEHYNKLAMGNITDSLEIKAPRGVLFDKNGIIIAENNINFILLLNRKKTKNIEETLKKIKKNMLVINENFELIGNITDTITPFTAKVRLITNKKWWTWCIYSK